MQVLLIPQHKVSHVQPDVRLFLADLNGPDCCVIVQMVLDQLCKCGRGSLEVRTRNDLPVDFGLLNVIQHLSQLATSVLL